MQKESSIQCQCVKLFRMLYPEYALCFFAVPNGSTRNKIEAARLKNEGVTSGVSDTLLLVSRYGYHGLCIEFKRDDVTLGTNGKIRHNRTYQSASQKEWQKTVESQGYKYAIVRCVDEFLKEIKDYLG